LNPAAQRLFGYTADEVFGHSMTQLVHDRTQPAGAAAFGHYSQVGRGGLMGQPVYLAAAGKGGRDFPVEMTLTSWHQGTETFLTAVIRDSSDRVQAEQGLRDALGRERKAVERLHALDGLKYTVLQAVAHDLRSPIAAVLTLTGILRADAQGERPLPSVSRAPMLADVERSIRKMERLLQDLLDSDPVRTIEASRSRYDVGELVTRVLAESDVATLHPVHTRIEPVEINVDAGQVERIVENLLNNAVRHLMVGVPVWISTVPAGDGVLISVEDAGVGVPVDLVEQIFEPFRRGEGPTSLGVGLGLGLSLVSRFAQIHGGRAWVEERSGGGASFRVYLPDSDAVTHDLVT
jgi:PAS domain S-box-containing protein